MNKSIISSLGALFLFVGCGGAKADPSDGSGLAKTREFKTEVYTRAGEIPLEIGKPDGIAFHACLPKGAKGVQVKAYFELNLTLKEAQFPNRDALQLEWKATKANGEIVSMINDVQSAGMPSTPAWFGAESYTLTIPKGATSVCFNVISDLMTSTDLVASGVLRDFQIHLSSASE